MKQSENINDLLSALCDAQADFKSVIKDANGHNYKYATLDGINNMLKPVLKAHGLGYMQSVNSIFPESGGEPINVLTTRVFDKHGEYIEDTVKLPYVKMNGGANDAQNLGGCITYMRRYTLGAMFGITTDEDVDAESAESRNARFDANAKRQQAAAPARNQNAPQRQAAPSPNASSRAPAPAGRPAMDEKKMLTNLYNYKGPDGKAVFTPAEIHKFFDMKNTGKTEREMITIVQDAILQKGVKL